mgnify:CR=1 FL=1
MKKTTIGIIIVIIVSFLGLVGYKMWSTTNFEKYDLNRIIPANEDNGQIGDHVLGKADAPVLLFEYGDFQCEGCASLNPILQTLVKEFEGKVGIVMRYFLLSYHQNATAAASAAEAAGKQGYYEKFADLLFKNQQVWNHAGVEERTQIFLDLFKKVSGGKGDQDKFQADMASSEVKKKINFDMGLGKRLSEITATPTLFMDGQKIDHKEMTLDGLRAKIRAKLGENQATLKK